MMRNGAILILLAAAACPLFAATPVTVAQLGQILEEARGKPDSKIAKQLAGLELTERVASVRLGQWKAQFSGKRTREQLTELADASAFLELPAADIPPDPAPNLETQHQLLSEAVDYVNKALSRLPNFYATRETTHFEDTLPRQSFEPIATTSASRGGSRSMGVAGMTVTETDYQPLHKTAVYSAVVQYRDGAEVSDPREMTSKQRDQEAAGLTTSGEFGPILYVVLKDGLSGKITWSHWEQGAGERLAVFGYSVPQTDSHYMVQLRRVKGQQQVFPGYHGEIAIDPSNGTILRLTVVSEMMAPYQAAAADILVEYAPVPIGDRTYVCPVRGVALSRMPEVTAGSGDLHNEDLQTQLNEVFFKDYHLFRGDTRILTGSGVGADVPQDPPPASQ